MIRPLDLCKDEIEVFKKFEKDTKFVRVDPVYCRKTYSNMVKSGNGTVLVLCNDRTGKIEGGIGCLKGPDLHCGVMTAVETFLFIDPECRGVWASSIC